MVFCLLPLYATFRKGLPFQFFWASCSCVTASVYHYALFQGLEGGIGRFSMDDLRSFDVLMACYCLGISLAYLIHANHALVLLSVRLVAPVSMVALYLQGAPLLAFAKGRPKEGKKLAPHCPAPPLPFRSVDTASALFF